MARFYTGSLGSVGRFPGRLVRLPADANTANAHPSLDYALIMENGETIHPLWPGTDEARRELDSIGLDGTDVTMQGRYYPSTGAILVGRIVAPK